MTIKNLSVELSFFEKAPAPLLGGILDVNRRCYISTQLLAAGHQAFKHLSRYFQEKDPSKPFEEAMFVDQLNFCLTELVRPSIHYVKEINARYEREVGKPFKWRAYASLSSVYAEEMLIDRLLIVLTFARIWPEVDTMLGGGQLANFASFAIFEILERVATMGENSNPPQCIDVGYSLRVCEEFFTFADRNERVAARAFFKITSKGGKTKAERSPKTQAKQDVMAEWRIWQNNPADYQGKTGFANAMLKDFHVLKNPDTVKKWCREWGKSILKST